jgi:hypothetical protein
MRLLLASTAIALLFGLSPASAMCGGEGQQAGMCGATSAPKTMSERTAKDWPTAPSQAQPEQKSGMGMMGGCPCCKNMAMMMDGMKSGDPHKGMDMPKQ